MARCFFELFLAGWRTEIAGQVQAGSPGDRSSKGDRPHRLFIVTVRPKTLELPHDVGDLLLWLEGDVCGFASFDPCRSHMCAQRENLSYPMMIPRFA